MIYTVLRQRHIKEAIHLEEQLARAREAAVKQQLADLEKKRQVERKKLTSAFEQVIISYIVIMNLIFHKFHCS